MEAQIGIVEDISGWGACKEIIYKCPKCATSFRTYGSHEKFCHGCGQKIDWNKMPTHLSKEYHEEDLDKREKFIAELNEMIKSSTWDKDIFENEGK